MKKIKVIWYVIVILVIISMVVLYMQIRPSDIINATRTTPQEQSGIQVQTPDGTNTPVQFVLPKQ